MLLKALAAPGADALGSGVTVNGLDADAAVWLRARGLGPYAFYRLHEAGLSGSLPPDVQVMLRAAYYLSVADTELHNRELAAVLDALGATGIVPILFKGAALAHTVYPEPACRPMGDLDLWLAGDEMPSAQAALESLGYVQHLKPTRPIALMMQHSGEIQMIGRRPGSGLVELHWGVFAGEWLRRTAVVDELALRERALPVTIMGRPARMLAAEDGVIQLAVHLAVNHQMAYPGLRGLLDLVLLARSGGVDWDIVAARASAWRVGTVTWLVLALAAELLGLDEATSAIERLRPSGLRRRLLALFVNARSLLAMRNLTKGPLRFVYQLLLVDRPGDAARLFWRAIWPEDAWLVARYGRAGSRIRWRHLWSAIRGKV